jgi:penicillin-binding protein 1A
VGASLALLAWIPWQRCGITGCPDVSRLGAYLPEGAPQVVDRHGQPIGVLQLADRVVVKLEDLPPFVPEAFLAVEDRRFFRHQGVDWRRVPSAAWANLRAREVAQGSSTITMQLARNVFSERLPPQKRTMQRKLLEIRVAREIESEFTKEEILELYLNYIYFGGGSRGIEAGSQLYFGHGASELTLAQAALMAALPKAPTHYDPRRHGERAQQRRDLVLQLMTDQGRISPEEAELARQAALQVRGNGKPLERREPFAGYFLEQVRRELEELFGDSFYRNPVRVVTTLDRSVQEIATGELRRQLRDIEHGAFGPYRGPGYTSGPLEAPERGTPYLQGAMVVLEADTGDVLAWIGGRDFNHSRFDRLEQGRRQPGSAFKPFVYASAFAAGHPLSERVSDQPLVVEMPGGEVWRPANFGNQYQESISLRDALVHSKNVATVRVGQRVGIHRALFLARDAGIARRLPRVPSVVLGSATVSPLELTAAFTPFATLGRATKPRLILRVEDSEGGLLWEARPPSRRPVMSPSVAYLTTDVLRDVVDRGTGRGARAAGYRGPAAGKTGTTNEQQDVWFIGYTPELVAGLWIGFDRPATIVPRATGGRLAAPVWGRVMHRVYQLRPPPPDWQRPPDIVQRRVDPATGYVFPEECTPADAYPELFIRGLEPPLSSCSGTDRWLVLLERWRGDLWDRFWGDREGMPPGENDEPRLGWQGEAPDDPADAFRDRAWRHGFPNDRPLPPEVPDPLEPRAPPEPLAPIEIEIEPVEIEIEPLEQEVEEPPPDEEERRQQEREAREREQAEREQEIEAERQREREQRERERRERERRPPPDDQGSLDPAPQ